MYMSSFHAEEQDTRGLTGPMLALLIAPFFLNDWANILVKDWHLWLLIDYLAVKLLPLALVFRLIGRGAIRPVALGLSAQRISTFCVTLLVVTLVGALIDQNGGRWLSDLPGYAPLGGMPAIGSPAHDRLYSHPLAACADAGALRDRLHRLFGAGAQRGRPAGLRRPASPSPTAGAVAERAGDLRLSQGSAGRHRTQLHRSDGRPQLRALTAAAEK